MIRVYCGPLWFRAWRDWLADSCGPETGSAPATRPTRVKLRIVSIAILGLALALYLLMHVGIGSVWSAVLQIGGGGFAILCAYGLGQFLILGAAWCVVLPASW